MVDKGEQNNHFFWMGPPPLYHPKKNKIGMPLNGK